MKTILITGSTQGIGKSIAEIFSKNGYTVILNARKKTTKSNQLEKSIAQNSPLSSFIPFDVTDEKKVNRAEQIIKRKYGFLDILVNCAGITNDSTLVKMSKTSWDSVIQTNLTGPFLVTKAFLPGMIEKKSGRIINISSVVARMGNYGQTNYGASKAGLIGFTKSLSKEVARFNITVNAICPGFTKTQMTEDIPQEILQSKILPKIPFGRLAEPDEIANLTLFLASEKSSYITGSIFDINGGLY